FYARSCPSTHPLSLHDALPICSALFVGGFAVVFMILGGFAGALGYLLQEHVVWINRIAGAIVILMGLVFMGVFPGLSVTRPASSDRKSTRLNSSHVSNSYAVFC